MKTADGDSAPVTVARVRRPADDWRAAIHLACEPLVEVNAVASGYPDRCVAMVEEHGPYIVLAPGIALAHARPEDGVEVACLAVVTLTEAVDFGHEANDPVDVVFAFGSPDADQHVGMLSELARHLIDGLADRLRQADDDADATMLLRRVTGGNGHDSPG
ncbi:MAG: PTS sugar transporter subunit IIA [Nitriliruptoraceae bacterium]